MPRAAILTIVLVIAGAGAGCAGGGDDTADRPTAAPRPAQLVISKAYATRNPERAYRQAHGACRPRDLDRMAKGYGLPADPLAVARAVASGFRLAVVSEARRGCEDGFAGRTTAVW